MSFDNAYEAITEDNDSRWAFGTGFAEPLAGIDASIPAEVDGMTLATYCLALGDDALIMSHRLQEWCTNAPELEDEVALANIGLDLLGQARLLLSRAGKADGTNRDEDEYAYFRAESEFRNVRIVEPADIDFAHAVVRLLIFSTWRLAILGRLTESRDPVLAAISAKGVKELTYHRDYSAQWVVRLGDGTEYSARRIRTALSALWPLVPELFIPHEVEHALALSGIGVEPSSVRQEFDTVLSEVLSAAHIELPDIAARSGVSDKSGRSGVHTEAMGYIIAELQCIARSNQEAVW